MQFNPVIEKEIKVKMRGWKAPALITAYLGFLGLVVLFSFLANNVLSQYNMNNFNPRVALNSYYALAVIQLGLLMFIVPAMTGGAISGEKERQTLDLLLCTNFSPLSIVGGKVIVSIAHIMLLITASLPILGTVFLYGGIGVADLALLFGFYIATALMLASIGIFYSTVFKRSTVSIIVTYITLMFLIIGTIVILAIWGIFVYAPVNRSPSYNEIVAFLFANPLYGFSSVFDGGNIGVPFLDIFYSMGPNTSSAGVWFKPWMANMLFDLLAAVLFILLSAWRIKPVKRKSRRRAHKEKNMGEVLKV